jgi:hypothetical protein
MSLQIQHTLSLLFVFLSSLVAASEDQQQFTGRDWLLNCCWRPPAQWFPVLSPMGPMTTLYYLTALGAFRTPLLTTGCPVQFSPVNCYWFSPTQSFLVFDTLRIHDRCGNIPQSYRQTYSLANRHSSGQRRSHWCSSALGPHSRKTYKHQ